jgi:hypothetical protein
MAFTFFLFYYLNIELSLEYKPRKMSPIASLVKLANSSRILLTQASCVTPRVKFIRCGVKRFEQTTSEKLERALLLKKHVELNATPNAKRYRVFIMRACSFHGAA